MFEERIKRYLIDDKESFRFQDYIIDVSGNGYRFGLVRGGHSGGYWFEPQVTEQDGNLVISGRIEYLTYPYDGLKEKKLPDKIEGFFLYVLLSPLILIVKAYRLMRGLIDKMRRRPIQREETAEDRLFYLMKMILGCARMS